MTFAVGMIGVHDLPTVNATLNALAATLLVVGRVAIARKNVALHKRCMVAAFVTSSVFLTTYVAHKILIAGHHTEFQGSGVARPIYFTILISHLILAIAIVPLALRTLFFALRGDFARHRRIARITWPIWLYVSVTGVVIWWMLYSGTFGPVAIVSR